jgi:hypothetical protein
MNNVSVDILLDSLSYLRSKNEDVDVCELYIEKLKSIEQNEFDYDSFFRFYGPELAKLCRKSGELYETTEQGLSYSMRRQSNLSLLAWCAIHYLKFKPAFDISISLLGLRKLRSSFLSKFPNEIVRVIAQNVWATRYNKIWETISSCSCDCCDCSNFDSHFNTVAF